MEFYANEHKKLEITVEGDVYLRGAVKTHFINLGEDYIKIIEDYIKPHYVDGDILSISEKVIALCQKRIITKEETKPSLLAKFLSKCAMSNETGPGVTNPHKMQFAINLHGSLKVLYAAILGALGKLVGKRGLFYEVVGLEISGLDGFYNDAFEEYGNYGIRVPENPTGVCNEIYEKTGVKAMIVDANDLNIEILGKADVLNKEDSFLKAIIKDNPAGQSAQCTPLILIRKK